MNDSICGGVIVCRPFDAIKSIQHSRTNILTSDDFKPRTLVDMIIRFLNRRIQP